MSKLLRQANETIYQIIDCITPNDIANFSLSCKEIHRLCHNALELHNQRRKAFSRALYTECAYPIMHSHPMRILPEICEDWRVAYYIRWMAIDGVEIDHQDWQTLIGLNFKEAETKETPRALANYSKQFGGAVQSLHDRYHALLGCSRDMMLAFLLILSPNLQKITFFKVMMSQVFKVMLHHITIQYASSERSKGSTALSRLAEIRIYGFSDPSVDGVTISSFEHWPAIPSLRSLFGKNILTGVDFRLDYEPKTSNVTEIILKKSAISKENIGLLLSGMKALKKFTYDYHRREQMIAVQGDHIRNVLRMVWTHSRRSLEYLSLTARNTRTSCAGGISLRTFEALKEARLPCNLFLRDEAEFEGEDDPENLKDWLDEIPRLIDVLPNTIEKMAFEGEITMLSIESLLVDLDGTDQARLIPKLRKVVFHEANVETKTMKMMAKAWKEGLRVSKINLRM